MHQILDDIKGTALVLLSMALATQLPWTQIFSPNERWGLCLLPPFKNSFIPFEQTEFVSVYLKM